MSVTPIMKMYLVFALLLVFGLFAHNAQMANLFNQQVKNTQKFEREGSWFEKQGKGFHQGTLVETSDGKKFLIHNTPKDGKVITDAKHMSKEWKPISDVKDWSKSHYKVNDVCPM